MVLLNQPILEYLQALDQGSANVLVDTSIQESDENLFSGATVTYKRGLKRITLERLLISKIVYTPEKVTFKELLTLYDNHVWLLEKCRIDPQFRKKFIADLESVSEVLKKTKVNSSNLTIFLTQLKTKLKVSVDYLIPQRNILGVEKHFRGHFHVQPHKPSGVPNNRIPPKPYIGIGYKDKGHRTDPALDGSPGWEEVASHHSELERRKDEQEEENSSRLQDILRKIEDVDSRV